LYNYYKKHSLGYGTKVPFTEIGDYEILLDGSRYKLSNDRTILKRINKWGTREFRYTPLWSADKFTEFLMECCNKENNFTRIVTIEPGVSEPKITELYEKLRKKQRFNLNVKISPDYNPYAPDEVYEFAQQLIGSSKLRDMLIPGDFHLIYSRDQKHKNDCLILGEPIKGIEPIKGNVVISCRENPFYPGGNSAPVRFSHEILVDLLTQCIEYDSTLQAMSLDFKELNFLYKTFMNEMRY
jgi:hypothetical protein